MLWTSLLGLLSLLGGALGKGGAGGGVGRASYGGGGATISRGYTRSFFFVYAGTRHTCASCSRTTAEDDVQPEMSTLVVLAEFDVEFPPGAYATAVAAAQPYVEQRVAQLVMRSAPTITASDVSTRRTRVGSDTVSYELAILTGEARAGDFDAASGVATPGTTAARVYEALGLCDNSTATQEVGTSEWTAPLVGGARIASCANRTLVPTQLESEVAAFGERDCEGACGFFLVIIIIFTGMVLLGICIILGELCGDLHQRCRGDNRKPIEVARQRGAAPPRELRTPPPLPVRGWRSAPEGTRVVRPQSIAV